MSRMKKIIVPMFLTAIFTSNCAYAKELGKRGQSFKIEEQSFQEMIMERLSKVDLEKEKEKMQELARDRIENPAPVAGISRVTEYRQWHHDPSYVLDEDAVLPCGKILHKAGTRVNPLEVMDLERRIFFIDGGDEEQVAWLEENIRKEDFEMKHIIQDVVVLVGGSPIKLSERLGNPVYFDQHDVSSDVNYGGNLTSKWHIKAVPAIVEQDGKYLKISEIKI